jgi:aldose sugar dehydrogenase
MTARGLALALAILAVSTSATVAALAPPAAAGTLFQPVVEGVAFPTNMAFAPDGRVFFTEKETGHVRILRGDRVLPRPFTTLPVLGGGERGLLGIALHPDFENEPWVYLYLSDPADARNRVVRLRADGDTGGAAETVIDGPPAASGYHNGGDLVFGPDGMLYVSTGEAHDPELAQDPTDVGGKILRIEPDGSVPSDNPFGRDDPVYASGIRNSFGLCFNPVTGDLWETENGPDRDDEVNRIVAGGNYGWPDQLGRGGGPEFVDPELVYPDPVVPTGCSVSPDGTSLFFGDFGGVVHRAELAPPGYERVSRDEEFATVPGGIVDVAVAPDRSVWLATPDTLWRSTFRLEQARSDDGGTPTPTATALAPSPATTRTPGPRDGWAGASIWGAVALAGIVAATLAWLAIRRRSR